MAPALSALVVHDLKNALGALEAELLTLAGRPDATLATQAHARCAELRQRFVMFLAVYGVDGRMRAQSTDESPIDLLRGLADGAPAAGKQALAVQVRPADIAPAFWYFDRRLVRMAMQAALHNAQRFARRDITLGARRDGDFMVLSIDDDGPGLGAVDPSQHSTGLGTELCRAVAAAHVHDGRSGRVTLYDRPLAGGCSGARFELWLP